LANHLQIDPGYAQTTRPFQGQAPFIVNLILSYLNQERGWESSLGLNITGEKLFNIALFGTPDLYEQPFPVLNFKVSKKFANHYQIGFNARNLINPANRKTQTYRGTDFVAEQFRMGSTFGLTLSYFIN
jgi:hypothetical protein